MSATPAAVQRSRQWFNRLAEDATRTEAQDGDVLSTGWTLRGEPFSMEFFDATAAYLRQIMELSPADRLVEVGCSAGLLLKKLQPFVRDVVGSDISQVALRRCAGAGLHVCEAEAERQPFADASFDAVVCQGVYQYFPDLQYADRATRELLRLVRPGGRVLIGQVHNGSLAAVAKTAGLDVTAQADVSSAWVNALRVTYRHLREAVSPRSGANVRPDVPPTLFIAPEHFLRLGSSLGCSVSFPLQVFDGPESNSLRWRYSVLLRRG